MTSSLSVDASFSQRRSRDRSERHLHARALVVANRIPAAIELMNETIDELGPHVGLLCDLAGCYYELGRFSEFQSTVVRAASDFNEFEDLLSSTSKRKTALMLGKFYEELAEPAIALDWLKKALEFCSDLEDRKWIFSNELRIQSYFGIKSGLQKKYLAVLEMHDTDSSLNIELLHSLLWSEWALFGYEHALVRWRTIQDQDLNEIDRRLVARDFIEISLLSGVWSGHAIELAVAELSAVSGLDIDRLLLRILTRTEWVTLDLGDYNLSLMMTLRILLLDCRKESSSEIRHESLRKYSFLTADLSQESRRYFKSIEPVATASGDICVDIHVADKRVSISSYDLNSKLTSLQAKFIQAMAGRSFLSADEVSERIWNEPSSESTYHRLRMLIYKLNTTFSSATCVTPFAITKDRVTLHSRFIFRIL